MGQAAGYFDNSSLVCEMCPMDAGCPMCPHYMKTSEDYPTYCIVPTCEDGKDLNMYGDCISQPCQEGEYWNGDSD